MMRPGLLLLRRLRLISGLILFAFVFGHLANLALGLVSLEALETWNPYFIAPWQTRAGRLLLAVCTGLHALLGLYAIAARRTLGFSTTDVVQWCLALAIPPLLVGHILALRVTSGLVGDFDTSYTYILAVYWSYAPVYAVVQQLALICVWTHGAIGLYSYLILQPIWNRVGSFVTPLLFAVPILSLLGFVEAGKEVLDRLGKSPQLRGEIEANLARAASVAPQLERYFMQFLAAYGALAALAVAIMLARLLWRGGRVAVAYDGGQRAGGRAGLSILEFSQAAGVPHSSVCGGRGRCGTCRVAIVSGAGALSPMADIERRTLAAVLAPEGTRLACQALVLGQGVEVVRILPPFADASAAREPQDWVASDAPAEAAAP